MSNYIVTDSELTSVANAIRTKGGTNGSLVFPGGFTSAISNISGGGGGSSDFSTAEVTVVVAEAESADITIVCIDNNSLIVDMAVVSTTYSVPLYKGECIWLANSPYTYSISGDASYDDDNGTITITGNGTITIS